MLDRVDIKSRLSASLYSSFQRKSVYFHGIIFTIIASTYDCYVRERDVTIRTVHVGLCTSYSTLNSPFVSYELIGLQLGHLGTAKNPLYPHSLVSLCLVTIKVHVPIKTLFRVYDFI